MSTEIKTILGSYHYEIEDDSSKHKTAELSITRFYNGTSQQFN